MGECLITRRASQNADLQYIYVGDAGGSSDNYTLTFSQTIDPKKIVAVVLVYDTSYITIHGGYNENYEKLGYASFGSNYYTTINSITGTQMNITVNDGADGYSHNVFCHLLCK